ncbi:hypothetical protein CH373_11630 [Leptospira perolatii]|uniref:DUF1554 domain-containing protein n=1 Tax=Leptospira perolatii TaxID=2023191 RepID=A0A2M9ZM09_9LEPT|nr:DUF1554 domain-containing protein [Leptospira perolatii]PJZ69118.1 hypothetical protein CH360_12635 [Leptospira perolatii]PJZ73138.1 hypothetical protein CH373_11630 [Leptospira perolatii]
MAEDFIINTLFVPVSGSFLYCTFAFAIFFFSSCVQWPVASALLEEPVENSDKNRSILALATQSNEPITPSSPTDLCQIPSPPLSGNCASNGGCYIFYAQMGDAADFGGIAGMDNLCKLQFASKNPLPVGNATEYKALLMDESCTRSLTRNWVLHPNTNYLSYHTNQVMSSTDSNGMLRMPLQNPLYTPGETGVFTGIDASGPTWKAKVGETCDNWTSASSSNFGRTGASSGSSGTRFVDSGRTSCNPYRIYCVRI